MRAVGAEAAALAQDSGLEVVVRESPAVEEVRAALADPEAAAAPLALAARVVEVAAESMPEICGVRQGRAEEAAELGLVVAVVRVEEGARAAEAELGSVVALVQAEGAPAAALAPAVPAVEVVQGAARMEALLAQLVLRERREQRLGNG